MLLKVALAVGNDVIFRQKDISISTSLNLTSYTRKVKNVEDICTLAFILLINKLLRQ